jgi:diguanylate cyclase (GGDEF)-like protein/PAS domain S-box-containing protein
VNREKIITYENPAMEVVLGLKPEERIGKHVLDNIHPDDRNIVIDTLNTWIKDKNAPVQKVEIRIRHIDGSWHTFESMATNLTQDDIDDTVIVNLRDITERKWTEEALRQSEEKYRSIIENIQEGYFEIDLSGNFTFYNDSVSQIIGYSKEELMGMNYRRFTSEQTAKQVFQAFNKVYNTGNPAKEFDWQIIKKDGTKIYIEVSVSLQKDLSGTITGFKGIIRDITERKEIDQQLTHMASHDALTGLPNRMLFMDRLDIALAQSRRSQNKLAVMMLDLDHFKDINDTLGHMAGDKLLQEVGDRLTGILRHNDTVARLGGDEFIVLLSDIERIEDVTRIAKVILKAFQKPFVLSDNHITSNASIGIAVYPDDCQDIETLLRKSDMAMYSVKTQGRNGYKFFSDVISPDLIN